MVRKIESKEVAITVIKQAAEKWKSSFIARDQVPKFTGGALSAGHMANLDSAGLGVKGSFKLGKRKCYPIDSLVSWLISRLEV